jgi:hypothetical protein
MWIYLPASVYSADTGASILPLDSPESNPEPCAMSSGTSTANRSSKPVSKTGSCMTRRSSGETSENSMDSPGVEEWISCLPAHRANLIVPLDQGSAPQIRETSSQIHSESLARYSPEESMWKTSLVLQLDLKMDDPATSQKSLVDFPRSGMTVGGTLYPLKTQAHRTCVNGGGSLPNFPTPQAMDAVTRSNESFHRIMDRPRQGKMLPKLADIIHVAPKWNTPNTMDSLNCKSQEALDHEHDTARPGRTNPNNLRDQVAVQEGLRLWPTPSTMDHIERKGMRPSRAATNRTTGYLSEAVSGGQLSATWVCWLMGLPLGWDSLEPLAEGAYAEWLEHMEQGTWWAEERGLPRLAEGQKDRVNRLKCLGNGIVPASGALAFITLQGE